MAVAEDSIAPFIGWINEPENDDDDRTWEERGLKSNAPESAHIAFSAYILMQNEARAADVKI